jgi:hypothetical protein
MKKHLKLRNEMGEDIYTIDMVSDVMMVSPQRPVINIFSDLVLTDGETDYSDRINMGEVFTNTLLDALDRKAGSEKLSVPAVRKERGETLDDILREVKQIANTFSANKIIFREISDCFPDFTAEYGACAPVDVQAALDELGTNDRGDNPMPINRLVDAANGVQ